MEKIKMNDSFNGEKPFSITDRKPAADKKEDTCQCTPIFRILLLKFLDTL